MQDSIIFEALKQSIVDAFFKQQQYYNQSGGYTSYGGQAVQLVEKILAYPEMKELISDVAGDVNKNKEKLREEVNNGIKGKVAVAIEDHMKGVYYSISEAVKKEVHVLYSDTVKEILMSNPVFIEKIKQQANSEDYTFNINVSVSIVKKETN